MARKAYTSEEVVKRMEALPEAAADFLYSTEMGGIVREIAQKHSLHIDQTGLLEAETGQLILGLTEPQDFAPFIADSLKIPAEQATAIAKDINDGVMAKIRTSMGQPSGAAPTASPAPTMPIPTTAHSTPSVIMPSSAAPTPSSAPAPAPAPARTASVTTLKPTTAPNLGAADAILSEKKVTPPPAPTAPVIPAAPATPAASPIPKVDPALPQNYKADPYREPVE